MLYSEVIKNVNSLGIQDLNNIYDYAIYSDRDRYDLYFQWCQEEMHEDVYGFSKPSFIFLNDKVFNAYAYPGVEVIALNKGIIETFKHLLKNSSQLFELDPYHSLQKRYESISPDTPWLILLFSVQFIFGHELGHLLQQHPQNDSAFSEMVNKKEVDDSLSSQVEEFDADFIAATFLGIRVIMRYEELPSGLQNEKSLTDLFTIALTGVFSYFLWQADTKEIYFEGFSHPHPLIRLIYFTEMIEQFIQAQPELKPLNTALIKDEVFTLSNLILERNAQAQINFRTIIIENNKRIELHIRQLRLKAESQPDLAINTFLKKATKKRPDER